MSMPFDFIGGHWLGIILGIVLAEYVARRAKA
jgi:hypothetical protein